MSFRKRRSLTLGLQFFNTTKTRGLGLGMPYAQKIFEQYGRKILVESKEGEGTQVKIELPAKKEQTSDTPSTQESFGR